MTISDMPTANSAAPRAVIHTPARLNWAEIRTISGGAAPLAAMRWILLATAGVGFLILAAVVSAVLTTSAVERRLAQSATTSATIHAAALNNELEKFRAMPFTLARDRDVQEALRADDERAFAALSRKFEALASETASGTIYVLDAKGIGRAASNWREKPSFLGCRCADRYYFTGAMKTGYAELFGVGRANQQPGLYIAHAVMVDGRPLGAVVVKVSFEALEKVWQAAPEPTFVTDRNGIVLISSVARWHFKASRALSPETRAALINSRQFGPESLAPLGVEDLDTVRPLTKVQVDQPLSEDSAFIATRTSIGRDGWSLHVLEPRDGPVRKAVLETTSRVILAGLLILTIVGILVYRREAQLAEIVRQGRARQELELRVEERTAELTDVNQRLREEMEERRRIEQYVQAMQDELVQANKLATLGQVSAGVAHEINQPLAAIRTYAENAHLLLERGSREDAQENLKRIGQLTQRINVITSELRAFARRAKGSQGPVPLKDAVEGALLLVSHRLRAEGVRLHKTPIARGVRVQGERVKVEQVLVNLLQNALDATAGQQDRQIWVEFAMGDAAAKIMVRDNGPGVSPAAMAELFMPFATTKPNGLGLGLVISRDIANEFGGDLSYTPREDGAAFTVTLRLAA